MAPYHLYERIFPAVLKTPSIVSKCNFSLPTINFFFKARSTIDLLMVLDGL